MRRLLRWVRNIIVLLVLAGVGLWAFGPREPMDASITFDAASIGPDIDAYLTEREARFTDITPGTQKRVVWAGAPGAQTDWAVVYLHGYSATSEEIRPVPDVVAKNLGANLYFTRLAGHGRGDLAMSEPSMHDWMQDLAEAMEIGRRIGKRVLVLTTSTGGTLAVAGLTQPETSDGLAGLVMLSPNFGPVDPMAELANWPLARTWVPAVAGEWREWQPHNDQQGTYWTTRYQTIAALPMMALVKYARNVDVAAQTVPALFIFSGSDQVVSADRTQVVYDAWGGPKQKITPDLSKVGDPSKHVVAGDILSPGNTAPVAQAITDWAGAL